MSAADTAACSSPGEICVMRFVSFTAAVICLIVFRPLAGAAEPPAESKRQAETYAEQALQCLHRGEDAADKTQKLAAYKEGLELASRAVSLDDDNADAHFAVFGNKGRILLLEGVTPNPISLLQVNRDLERTLQLNPNHADALAAKGGLYRQLPWVLGGSLSVAETCLTKAIAIDPDAVGARIELAETYRDMGHPERGLPLLQTAASIAERQGKQRQLREARDLLRQLQQP
jgi:tetratricopeptide (TPR) repeat protein